MAWGGAFFPEPSPRSWRESMSRSPRLLGWSLVAVSLAVLVPAATLLARSDDAPAVAAPLPSLVAPVAAQAPAADPELQAFLAAAHRAGDLPDALERCLS